MIGLRPDFAEVHNNLGAALKGLGRLDEAITAYGRAVAVKPDYPAAWSNLGEALMKAGRLEDAEAACRRAVALAPALAQAHNNLGAVLTEAGRFDEAEAVLRTTLALRPDYAEALSNLGRALVEQGRHDEAVAAYRRALAFAPGLAEANANLGSALILQARQAEGMAYYEAAIAARPDVAVHKALLACATYRDDLDGAALRALHTRFGTTFAQPADPLPDFGGDGDAEADPDRRLRIGYLSSDLREHPVGHNLLPVLRRHDRTRFSPHLYAHVPRPSAMTAAFRALADGWCDIAGLTDAQVAERIRADRIDILVSLAGRFDNNRPLVCARRAAPIQISLHDVATSGLAGMDYLIADRWLSPRGSGEFFTERVLRLPSFPVAALPAEPPGRAGRGDGPPVFGCFNNPCKITPTALALWGRILAAVPGSTLVLKYMDAYGSPELCDRLRGRLAAAGAGAGQVRFLGGRESGRDFLARYHEVDIALDTLPFSGSTTSFQALAMGVPVVTWPWDRMVSRWTFSMLRTLHLDELIAHTGDGYVGIAVDLAHDIQRWRRRRHEIRRRVAASSLCDSRRWAGNVERLYRAVWRRRIALGTGMTS